MLLKMFTNMGAVLHSSSIFVSLISSRHASYLFSVTDNDFVGVFLLIILLDFVPFFLFRFVSYSIVCTVKTE